MKTNLFISAVVLCALAACKKSGDSEQVWVQENDGALQCQVGSGKAVEEGGARLKAAGVQFSESKKAKDESMMQIQQCGTSQGTQNRYLIKKSDLSKAHELGLVPVRN